MSDKCQECGLEEHEHHNFVSSKSLKPKECKCDPDDWGEGVPEVCNNYVDLNDKAYPEGYCTSCHHSAACHNPA